jgi:subtilase family serine protease
MRKWVSMLAVIATAAGGLAAAAAPASGESARHTIPNSHASWATPAARVGTTKSDQRITFRVYLNLADKAGAEQAALAVSTPGSASYHQYLTSAQVNARYAPTAASVAAVKSWLQHAGATLSAVPSNNQYVEATATAATVARIFAVRLGQYRVRGRELRATDGDLSVPASIAGLVSGVIGVDQALNLLKPLHTTGETTAASTASAGPGIAPPSDGFRNARPCSAYWAQKIATVPSYTPYGSHVPYAPCGYTPPQLRAAYGIAGAVNAGIDGRGTTVGIVDAFASPTILADARQYAAVNDPNHLWKPNQFHQHVFPNNDAMEAECDASGWYGEETLDVEAVHAMAPGANVLYVGASDCQDNTIDVALNWIVANNAANLVSNSYGDQGEAVPADEISAFENIAIQAALEGIGLYFSSGDDGDESANLPQPSADFSASSPWVTAVGGTSLGITAAGGKAIETGWETTKSTLGSHGWTPKPPGDYLYGSGGGTSRLFSEPGYQKNVVPAALATENQKHGQSGRVVPDISMLGDPTTGMLVGQTQVFPDGTYYDQYRIGGTSLSSPLFTGVMADADQRAHRHHGFANPLLYSLAGSSAVTDVVHRDGAGIRVDYVNGVDATDGTVVSIRTFDFQGLSIHTAPGYDNVTGLGTPNGSAFLQAVS